MRCLACLRLSYFVAVGKSDAQKCVGRCTGRNSGLSLGIVKISINGIPIDIISCASKYVVMGIFYLEYLD